MGVDSDDPVSAAIEPLKQSDLSTNAPRTFVALDRLCTDTARDRNRVAEVPRTRVSGAVEEPEEGGLIDGQQAPRDAIPAAKPFDS